MPAGISVNVTHADCVIKQEECLEGVKTKGIDLPLFSSVPVTNGVILVKSFNLVYCFFFFM